MHPLTREFLDNVPLPGKLYKAFGHPLLANWARIVRVHDLLAE